MEVTTPEMLLVVDWVLSNGKSGALEAACVSPLQLR